MRERPVDSIAVYVGAGLISGCGALFFNVMPVFVGALADSFAATTAQLGDLVVAFNVGFTAAAVTAIFWAPAARYRVASRIAVSVIVLTLVLMSRAQSLHLIAALLAILGIAMGSLYSIVLAILASSRQPDRAFGVKLGLETLPGTLLLFLLPAVVAPRWGFDGVVLAMAMGAALLGFATILLPRGWSETAARGSTRRFSFDWRPATAFASSLFFFTGVAASWAFLELLADRKHLSAQSVGTILSIGFVLSGVGGFAAAAISRRFGVLAPMICIAIVNWAGLWALGGSSDIIGYAFGSCAFLFTVNFALAYTFGLTADVDTGGGFVVLSAAALSVGAIIGPGVGGRLVESGGFGTLLAFSAVCTLMSLICHVAVASGLPGSPRT